MSESSSSLTKCLKEDAAAKCYYTCTYKSFWQMETVTLNLLIFVQPKYIFFCFFFFPFKFWQDVFYRDFKVSQRLAIFTCYSLLKLVKHKSREHWIRTCLLEINTRFSLFFFKERPHQGPRDFQKASACSLISCTTWSTYTTSWIPWAWSCHHCVCKYMPQCMIVRWYH